MNTLKSNAFSVLKGLPVKHQNTEEQSLESLGYVPPQARKKSPKAELTQKMLKALKDGNLEKFSAAVDAGANFRVQCDGLSVVLYIIYKMSPEFLDCLIEKTNFSLKNPTAESMKGIDIHSFRAYKDLTDLFELAGENPNPKMLERLLKDIPTDASLWTWLPEWKSEAAMNWFLKTQDLFPKHLEPKRKIKEKFYLKEFITNMFYRNTSDWDPVSFLKRIKDKYPEVLKVMQTPKMAENIWMEALSPSGSQYKKK